ncbi:MAG TPA: SpoIIE family protein phosphatase [Bacteroidia bacterium]|nr:SpoIIE family protein phosphatase [Bacteroidia bacterium]
MTTLSNIVFILSVAFAAFAILQLAQNAKLKKENKSFQNIFQHTNDALLLIDIIDGKILYCNLGAQEMLGYRLDELLTKTIFDIHSREQLGRSSEVIATVFEQKGLIYTDLPFISASGEKIDVECSAKVEDFAGKVVIFISARDIRERLRMQEQIKKQSDIIEQKNKDLIDSINYARNIQQAILPSMSSMMQAFPEMFVLYTPKDIVSGDFYWYNSGNAAKTSDFATEGTHLDAFAVVDCTGHGVPGAFMSLVGYTLLNQTISMPGVNSPAQVLSYMSSGLLTTLNKKQEEIAINDGMDMSVCVYNRQTMKLRYAGANHVMYHIRNSTITSYNGDKQAIGLQSVDTYKPYTNHEIQMEKGDVIYMFSDGFEDQFGGEKGKKYKSSRFREFLQSIHANEMPKQKILLEKEFSEWKGKHEQLDDVLVIGIRF